MSQKFAIVKPSAVIASIDIIDPPPPAPWKPINPFDPGVATVFSSAEIPNEVIDVFCVDPDILDADPTFLSRFYSVMAETAEFGRRHPKTAIAHKCRQMGIEPSAWDSAAMGVRYFELKDQHEWIWGSQQLPTIHARLAEVIRATCGPRRDPVRPIHAGHRFAPELIAPAAPR